MISEAFIGFLNLLLWINLIGILFLSFLRIYFIGKSKVSNYSDLKFSEPFVSIHFAICDEPAEIVLDTLHSFKDLNYTNFEVIIVSNNTKNLSSWKPIASFAKEFENFKFFHFDLIDGYKAGALNIALNHSNHNTDYIFTVDSDYKLHPNALRFAVGSIQEKKVDVLQFPQDYRNTCSNTEGLQTNYKHYFECYLSAMDEDQLGLPTGTLTLIKMEVFKNGLSWPTETITEDAHFGVELLSRKFKIGYCNLSIGTGTMPTSVNDYNKQYKRWLLGNFQTLVLCLKKKEINVIQKLRLFTMLTAWINLLAVPIIISFLGLPFLLINTNSVAILYVLIISSLSVHIITQLYVLLLTSKGNYSLTFKALLVHISTIEIGSFHWLTYFINTHKPFIRTNKYLGKDGVSYHFLLLPLILFLSAFLCLLFDSRIVGLALLTISSIALIGKLRLMYELFYSKDNLSKLYRT